jgi:hypothetical protein
VALHSAVAAVSDRRAERRSESAATEKLRQSQTAATVVLVRERPEAVGYVTYQHFPIHLLTAWTAKRLLATEPIHCAFKRFCW